jgi:hypothetical protein
MAQAVRGDTGNVRAPAQVVGAQLGQQPGEVTPFGSRNSGRLDTFAGRNGSAGPNNDAFQSPTTPARTTIQAPQAATPAEPQDDAVTRR